MQKIALLFCLLISSASAHNFGDTLQDHGYHIISTSDGGFIICGDVNASAFVAKLNECGDLQWSKTFTDSFPTHANCIVEDNGYAVMGAVIGGGQNGGARAWLLKLNYSGDSLWSKFYQPDYWADLGTYITARNNGYVICLLGDGQTSSNHHTLFLTDTFGIVLDTVVVNASGLLGGFPSEVSPTSDGGLISASTNGLYDPLYLIQVVKVDQNFNIVFDKWYQDMGFSYGFYANAVCETSGGYMVAGACDASGSKQLFYMMLDQNGDSLYSRTLGSGEFVSVKSLSDGFIMAGTNILVRTDLNGDTIWTKELNNTIRYMNLTSQGYMLIGDTVLTLNNTDIFVMLTDTSGDVISCTTLGLTAPVAKPSDEVLIYDLRGTLMHSRNLAPGAYIKRDYSGSKLIVVNIGAQ